MKEHVYLVSSLPYLRFGEKPAMDIATFRAACVGWLTDDELDQVDAVLSGSALTSGVARKLWNQEMQLRNAISRVRAKNHNTDSSPFLKDHDGFSVMIEKKVSEAFSKSSPLEQEMEIDRIRWIFAEELAVSDAFGFSAVLGFALKVRIAERWAKMDDQNGSARVEEFISGAIES